MQHLETWVLLLRFLPRKSTSGSRPWSGPAAHPSRPAPPGSCQAQARKERAVDAKCSSEISSAHSAMAMMLPKNSRMTLSLQLIAVGRKARVVPTRLVLTQADEPAEHHVEIEMFHQRPLRANGEQALQQQGTKQALGAIDGRPPSA